MTGLRRLLSHPSAAIGSAVLGVLVLASLIGPVVSPHDPERQALSDAMRGPSSSHWLGTDEVGRDLLTRLLAGGRISLVIGVGAVALGLAIGGAIGLISGYAGGRVDLVIQRINDAMFAFSSLLLALALVAILGPGVTNVIISVGISTIPVFIRLGRAQALVIRQQPYIQTAELLGVGRISILARHVLRNALTPLIVQASVVLGAAILAAAGLGFLGLGIQEPQAEWGAMLGSGRQFIFSDLRLILVPGVAIFLAVARCPACLTNDVAPEPVGGRGTLYSFTVNHQAWIPASEPYVIGLVELAEQEGLRLTTNIVDVAPEDVRIGMDVEVCFEHADDVWVPQFRPSVS